MNAAMSQRAAGEILKPYSVGGSSRLGRWVGADYRVTLSGYL